MDDLRCHGGVNQAGFDGGLLIAHGGPPHQWEWAGWQLQASPFARLPEFQAVFLGLRDLFGDRNVVRLVRKFTTPSLFVNIRLINYEV